VRCFFTLRVKEKSTALEDAMLHLALSEFGRTGISIYAAITGSPKFFEGSRRKAQTQLPFGLAPERAGRGER